MTIPANQDTQKVYLTPTSPQPTYVHSGPGEQYAAWSAVSLGDVLEVVENVAQAVAKVGQPGQWIQVRDRQGHVGWVSATAVGQAWVSPVAVVSTPPPPSSAPVISPAAGTMPGTTPPPTPLAPVAPTVSISAKPLIVRTSLPNGQWIRSAQDLQAPTVDSVTTKDRLEVVGDLTQAATKVGKYPEWLQVKTPRGVVGWAAAWYLEIFPEYYVWSEGHALVGLHGPTETWPDRWDEDAFRMIGEARIEAVKMMASNNLSSDMGMLTNIVNRLRGSGVRFIMARLFAKFETPRTPEDFVNEVLPDSLALYNLGVRCFEVHNEPNLHILPDNPEGMFVAWDSGAKFGEFFNQAVALLKQKMPQGRFGFPGVSPAAERAKQIYRGDLFLNEADAAVRSADFVCMHTYWGGDGSNYLASIAAIQAFCNKYPDKLIFVTEFADTAGTSVSKDIKGREYALFYNEARKLPSNLGALFSYAMKSAGNDPDQMWEGSSIAEQVGGRGNLT